MTDPATWLFFELQQTTNSKQSLATIHRYRSFGSLALAYEHAFGYRQGHANTTVRHALLQLVRNGDIFRRKGPGGHWLYTTDPELAKQPITYKRPNTSPI